MPRRPPKNPEPTTQLEFIREPLHNLREIAKQLLCLEDHICCSDRRCHDCIRKHLLYAEALAEEGAAMDLTGEYRAYLDSLARSLRAVELELFGGAAAAAAAAAMDASQRIKQMLREHRKYIVKKYGGSWVGIPVPSAYASASGQQPTGVFAKGEAAEAVAASTSSGIRYNAGTIVLAGDVHPGPSAQSAAGGSIAVRSGNTAAEASVNMGIQAVAATSTGARAVAGSGAYHTAAATGGSVSHNRPLFRPSTVHNPGNAVAFTDIAPLSAAVSGTGNGPVAVAVGDEVAAMARSEHGT
ncbi:hypothetical protein OEZ85_011047 [Tetradesmus obliquus]|uniref:Inhibitor of growth protein N-terminal histone-binding domain-containing protein n=1 Tax=Tetradesmus obliquus TaxID=3088 RepID=A0ABY8TRE8_TETOB|nr:hypothetical protein OEZ85_011047 [Tetradesmus obliquus]